MADKRAEFDVVAKDNASRKLTDVADAMDKAGKSADGAGDKFSSFGSRVSGASGRLREAGDRVRDIGARVRDLGPQLRDAGRRFTEMAKGGLALAAVAGGAAVGAALMKGLNDYLERSTVVAKLGVQLGGGAETAAAAGRVVGRLYTSAFGESMPQVASAVKAVFQNIGEGSEEWVEDISAKVLTIADVFEQDLGGTTRAVGQMLRTGLARDAEEALDVITAAMSTNVDKAGDLLDTVNEYGTHFRALGLNGAEAMGLLSQGLQAGARDADQVADALKEFVIEAVAGAPRVASGFQTLGLDAKSMSDQFAKGGPAARDALDLVLDRLRAIQDPVERNAAAIQLFGTKAEDMLDAIYALDPTTAVQYLGQVEGAAQRAVDAMGATPAAKVEAFKRSLSQGFVDGFGQALLSLEGLNAKLGPFADDIRSVFGPAFRESADGVRRLWAEIQPLVDRFFRDPNVVAGMRLIVLGLAAIVASMAAMSAGTTAAVAATVAALAGLVSWFVGTLVRGILGGLATLIQKFGEWLVSMGNAARAIPQLRSIGDAMVQAGKDAQNAAGKVRHLSDTIAGLKSKTVTVTVNNVVKTIRQEASGKVYITGGGTTKIAQARGGPIRRAAGGPIPGLPSRVDSVPLLAAPGEFMVNASASSKNARLLDAINSGRPISLPAQRGAGDTYITVPVTVHAAAVGSEDYLSQVVSETVERTIRQGRGSRLLARGA